MLRGCLASLHSHALHHCSSVRHLRPQRRHLLTCTHVRPNLQYTRTHHNTGAGCQPNSWSIPHTCSLLLGSDDRKGSATTARAPLLRRLRHTDKSRPPWLARSFSSTIEADQPDLHAPPPEPLDGREKQAFTRELRTVTIAITANILIFFCKGATWWFTGSSAMFGEAVHSIADTMNQVLLRIGILRSQRSATDLHPYGFLKEKFLWALVSAVGIFCLGAGVTVAHGVMALNSPVAAMHDLTMNLAVLSISFVVEGYSLMVATRSVMQGATAAKLGFWEYLSRGLDPTSVAVMLEDGAAVTGLVIAGVATLLVHVTGNPVFDAAGSITIGALLGATACFLIQQNRSFLIGRAMHTDDIRRVTELLRNDYVIKAVHDIKSEEIGPGIYRFKAEMEFHGERVVERHLRRLGGIDLLHAQIDSAIRTGRQASLDLFLHKYGSSMINALGAEVDRLEADVAKLCPGIRHIDLETDRGRSSKAHREMGQGLDSLQTIDVDDFATPPVFVVPSGADLTNK